MSSKPGKWRKVSLACGCTLTQRKGKGRWKTRLLHTPPECTKRKHRWDYIVKHGPPTK